MQYVVSFLEGIITFISPCLLPMLPVYISYFAGGGSRDVKKTVTGAVGFVLGFTVVFVSMGALAGSLGGMLIKYRKTVDLVTGIIVIIFGLNYLGVFELNIFKGVSSSGKRKDKGFLSSFVLGIIFSLGWTPCVGAFLGSALLLASQQATMMKGMLMLLSYSFGLGIPFILSAVLIDNLKSAFDFIKRNYKIINAISGLLLVVLGILMATGTMGRVLNLLA